MTLSRTSRILLAVLLLAVAIFAWVNLAGGGLGPPTPVGAGTPPPDAQAEAPDPTPDAPANAPVDTPDDVAADVDPAEDAPSDVDVVALPSPDGDAPPSPRIVARDVELATFPATPDADDRTEGEASGGDGEGDDGGVLGAIPDAPPTANASVARATRLNPFAAVAAGVPGDGTADAASPSDAAPDPVAARSLPAPTVPTAATPQAPRRALPGRMLASAPALLQRPRTDPGPAAVATGGGVAAGGPDLPRAAVPASPTRTPGVPATGGAGDAPDLLGAAGGRDLAAATGGTLAPTLNAAGVRFTGSVVGSVGVGVFRMAGESAPVVLALGQSLPGSDIVLADVGGTTATFALGDATHVLTLDPRR